MLLLSSRNPNFSLHFLPAFPSMPLFKSPHHRITCLRSPVEMPLPSFTSPPPSPRHYSSREGSYDSQTSNHTIHSRRTLSRCNSSARTPPPPPLNGFADFFHSTVAAPVRIPEQRESDAEIWERMLMLQREYHCYKSARLEAAVEALEMGWSIEEVPMREFHPEGKERGC
jgi:hypothetical protein